MVSRAPPTSAQWILAIVAIAICIAGVSIIVGIHGAVLEKSPRGSSHSYSELYPYVSGVVELVGSNVSQLLGVDPRYLHFFVYVANRGWVEVPIRVFDKCLTVGNGVSYCIVPHRIGVDTEILVKVPFEPLIPIEKALNFPKPLPRSVNCVNEAYSVRMKVGIDRRVRIVSYLVIVSNRVNKWVLEGELLADGAESDFDAWSLRGADLELEELWKRGFPSSMLAKELENCLAKPIKLLSIDVSPLGLRAPRCSKANTLNRVRVVELVPPLRTWRVNGSAWPKPLVIRFEYQFVPQEPLSKCLMGKPATESITLFIEVRKLKGFGVATLSVEMVCSHEVVDERSYVVYKDLAVIKPTFYEPPCTTVDFVISLMGKGLWSVSIEGVAIVKLADAKPLKESKLSKELDLYVLGSPKSSASLIALSKGVAEGSYVAALPIPSDLALILNYFYNWSEIEDLAIRITNLGSVGAYVSICCAGTCSERTYVKANSSRDVVLKVRATSINAYLQYLQPIPVFVEVGKASIDGYVALELQPLNALTLLARPPETRSPIDAEPRQPILSFYATKG